MTVDVLFKELDMLMKGRKFDDLSAEEQKDYLRIDKEICAMRKRNN